MKFLARFPSLLFLSFLFLLLPACADDLDVANPNEPELNVLDSEEGLKRAMLGVYFVFDSGRYIWFGLTHHEIMGDALYVPWGNFGWRWANQPTTITLDDGTVITPPEGGTQEDELVLRNDRAQGDNNAFIHEWADMYRINNIGNLLLNKLDEGGVSLSGDAAAKEASLRAWSHFWKGFAYSRIGSLYAAGIVTDESGETNPDFVTQQDIITEANSQLDAAITALNSIDNVAAYEEMMMAAIPDYMRPNGIISPEEFVRNINTLKARNILVNTRVDDMSNGQWEEVRSLAAAGLRQGDVLMEFYTALENAAFDATIWHPWRVTTVWAWVSERLIQEYKDGDARFERNFSLLESPQVNRAGRGIQYGTRFSVVPIESGGDVASQEPGLASLGIAGSWEETVLMEAEALIMTGSVEEGLALIDDVRAAQAAELDNVADTGLSMEEAYEELRIERRVGLFLRGVAFYDARRWGVIDPVSEGGGRTGAVVLDAEGNLNTNATFNYNYLSYWGVPDGELDFNTPAEGSASVAPF